MISIVIPVYNEAKRIEKTLHKTIDFCNKHFSAYELIVVDDGSIDATREIVEKYSSKEVILLKHTPNKGKGYSVKQGILSAKYPLVVFFDSDLSTPLKFLLPILKNAKKYDVVIASRNLSDSVVTQQSFLRIVSGKLFSYFVRLMLLPHIKDSQCGCKLFKTSMAKKLAKKMTIQRFAFDVELLFLAKKSNYSILEYPVQWTNKTGSKVHIFRDSFLMFKDVLKIWLNSIMGKY
jgi:dolichyl-phosphate beta-glucosyltransferase